VTLTRAAFRGGQIAVVDQARQQRDDALGIGRAGGGAQRGKNRGDDDRAAGDREDCQRRHGGRARDVGGDHDRAAVMTIGKDAGEWAERDLGHDPRGGRDTDPHRRPGALVDKGEQGEVVEPVARLGDDEAAEQEAQVALAQRHSERTDGIQHLISRRRGGAEPTRARAGRCVAPRPRGKGLRTPWAPSRERRARR
jgi:hypothetical protein